MKLPFFRNYISTNKPPTETVYVETTAYELIETQLELPTFRSIIHNLPPAIPDSWGSNELKSREPLTDKFLRWAGVNVTACD